MILVHGNGIRLDACAHPILIFCPRRRGALLRRSLAVPLARTRRAYRRLAHRGCADGGVAPDVSVLVFIFFSLLFHPLPCTSPPLDSGPNNGLKLGASRPGHMVIRAQV